jgi:hypothetical protein
VSPERLRVYLDDEREAPPGWFRVYTAAEAIELLQTGRVEEISLDHDLGPPDVGTGYDVVAWLEARVISDGFAPPLIRIHTANPVARVRMEAAVRSIERALEGEQDEKATGFDEEGAGGAR